MVVNSHEQRGQDGGSGMLTRSLSEDRAPAERLLWPMRTAISLVALILLHGSALSQSHLKPSPLAARRNSSNEIAGQTPPPSFASSGRLPLYFIENQGQVDNHHVSHYVQGRDRTIYFAPDGLTFALLRESRAATGGRGFDPDTDVQASSRFAERPPPSRWVVKLDFLDASRRVQPTGRERTRAVVSYFKGPAEQRVAGLPTFAELVYSELWPGIDLVYSGTVQRLKYRFVVAPGADPGRIRLAYRGAEVQLTRNGQLDLSTPFGGFQDAQPLAYQDIEGERVEVNADFVLQHEPGGGTTHPGLIAR